MVITFGSYVVLFGVEVTEVLSVVLNADRTFIDVLLKSPNVGSELDIRKRDIAGALFAGKSLQKLGTIETSDGRTYDSAVLVRIKFFPGVSPESASVSRVARVLEETLRSSDTPLTRLVREYARLQGDIDAAQQALDATEPLKDALENARVAMADFKAGVVGS